MPAHLLVILQHQRPKLRGEKFSLEDLGFGFLLGACIALGGGGGAGWKKKRRKRLKDKEWEEIGKKVEEKVCKGIKEWLDESEKKDDDWEEIGRKIEEKIKRKLRDWAED